MNIQEYISSGVIESYVLGLASAEERAAFEELEVLHPEVRAAREAFELSLENHALSNAITPPSEIKQKVWATIKPVVGMQSETPVRRIGMARYMSAAAIILLIGSTALNFYFYNRYRSTTTKYDELVAGMQQMAKDNSVQQAKLDLYASSFRMMNDTNMAVVALKGRPLSPLSKSTIYWDKQTKNVWLQVNNLPEPSAGTQYQLWAIVDGQPVDAGVFDVTDPYAMVKLKNIPRAEAFAITLEKKGGSPAPHLDAMYVMGAVG